MSFPTLGIQGMTAGYDHVPVLEGLAFEAWAGKVTAIVGPNASGKSTVFRSLFAHGAWLTGDIRWMGTSVRDLRDPRVPRHDVAWVRQDRQDFDEMLVRDVLLALGRSATTAGREVDRVIARIPNNRLGPLLTQGMRTLSGGQRAIVGIAMALVHEPSLLCLDEPAAGLDAATLSETRSVLRDYLRDRNAACVMVEHRKDFISDFADVIIRMPSGERQPASSICETPDLQALDLSQSTSSRDIP
jgi:ABC-type branched-subunit amino acid transport system ATPase component